MVGNGEKEWETKLARGVQLVENKMVHNGRWCVPAELSGRVVRAHHAQIGHVGGERLRKELVRRYSFEPKVRIDQDRKSVV